MRLDAAFAAALAEAYAVGEDYCAAWRHARLAERHGDGPPSSCWNATA